ncbi:terminase gpA endonuclease subunit [Paracoccus sp. (in: a-proteobacteria)]|uniref:terminase gpA endonuclease subunit n=1 Tax=Paracoccus sp. TaxID=267 RepID=UPI0026DF639A|nr:terminase gpA endonuclease subunit [Paracoccus sp. (in: a-proteobacteria)]MDO5646313.1 phage terminase large subunit family protein [Paracoccus sp. (in: a-proteobacteria)]
MTTPSLNTIEALVKSTLGMVRPAEKMSVSEWAAKKRYLSNQGSHVGLWDSDRTPYMNEPMDTLASLRHTGMIFAGPARTGKTDSFGNWLGHTADTDPKDMLFYGMTQSNASEWSQRDLAKVIRAKPIGEKESIFERLLRPGKRNVFDAWFKSGMQLMIRWASITELSGKTVPFVWFSDYDRIPFVNDIEGQGPAYWLGKKRTETLGRFAMTAAEASPGFEITEENWIAETDHEAPPTLGILQLYNDGDRRRWYWKCPDCLEWFEAHFDLLSWPSDGTFEERAEQAVMVCPHCGVEHGPERKYEMNRTGRWLREGQRLTSDDQIIGEGRKSDIASFWLNGAAAGFQTWKALVLNYLRAMDAYERTGDTGPLKKTMNTDQGVPFVKPKDKMGRLPEDLKSRAEDWGAGDTFETKTPTVPPWVRFLVATVDVQARSFVVQVTGVGDEGDFTIVDAFKIVHSNRVDENDLRRPLLPIEPAAYAEDWDILIPEVIEKTYPLSDASGRVMSIKISGCDMGGREGVSPNAYDFWRRLRDDKDGRGHDRRFHLVKGEPSKSAPRRKTGFPDSNQGGKGIARGDVPVQFLNSNLLKDQLHGILGRDDAGGVRWRFPTWSPNFIYKQMCAEKRTAKGWENPSGRRNETWDLSYYAIGLCLHPDVKWEHLKWEEPETLPAWARQWDINPLVSKPGGAVLIGRPKPDESLASLASEWL